MPNRPMKACVRAGCVSTSASSQPSAVAPTTATRRAKRPQSAIARTRRARRPRCSRRSVAPPPNHSSAHPGPPSAWPLQAALIASVVSAAAHQVSSAARDLTRRRSTSEGAYMPIVAPRATNNMMPATLTARWRALSAGPAVSVTNDAAHPAAASTRTSAMSACIAIDAGGTKPRSRRIGHGPDTALRRAPSVIGSIDELLTPSIPTTLLFW